MELFYKFMEKDSFYTEITDMLMNVTPSEKDSFLSHIFEKISEFNLDIQPLYSLISDICEFKIANIHEYWYIYDKIYQQTKINPQNHVETRILDAVFAKKYRIKTVWGGKYHWCETKGDDEILKYYESDPIMLCLIHDDIKSLKEIINNSEDFNFEMQIFDKSLIENACFCGALQCFRFLRSNNIEVTKKCLDYSIDGRNQAIIDYSARLENNV